MKICQHCVYFCETVGYCSLHDRDVTRYNGCNRHMTWNEYQNGEDDEQESTKGIRGTDRGRCP